MGDRSVISTPRDTLGKPSCVYDDARNVKDSEGRTVDGNVPPQTQKGAEKTFSVKQPAGT